MPKHLCDDRARWRPVRWPTFPSVCARTSSNSHPVTNARGFPRTFRSSACAVVPVPESCVNRLSLARLKCALRRSPACHELFLTVPLTAARRLREVGARHCCRCRQVAIQRPGWGLRHTRRLRTDPHWCGPQAVGQGPAGQYQCVYRIQLSMQ